jgi:perosamine synthetase
LRLLRNLAFTTPRFRHEVAGYNFRMTGYQAAMGLSQFRRIDSIIQQKRRLAAAYNAALWGIPGIQLPAELEWATNVYWMYSITVDPPFPKTRDELMALLLADEIDAFSEAPCPVADRIWTTGLYLPSTFTLDDAAVGQIADSIRRAAA